MKCVRALVPDDNMSEDGASRNGERRRGLLSSLNITTMTRRCVLYGLVLVHSCSYSEVPPRPPGLRFIRICTTRHYAVRILLYLYVTAILRRNSEVKIAILTRSK